MAPKPLHCSGAFIILMNTSGSIKDRLARAIFDDATRRDMPWSTVRSSPNAANSGWLNPHVPVR
jgi:hypothetical protein